MEIPDVAELRRRVGRGRKVRIALGQDVSMAAASEVARELRLAMGADLAVFATPSLGDGPGLTVLQLVGDAEAAALRPALGRLVAEFRGLARELVAGLDAGSAPPGWSADPHGPHCRFENEQTGEVVDAHLGDPDLIDPYFLLVYAETSGRHDAVLEACVERYHDMRRLLETIGIGRDR